MTTPSNTIEELVERVEAAKADDWRLNDEIIAALGGVSRRVTRLGLNGRTKGSMRVFWEGDTSRQGKRYPNFVATPEAKARAIKSLRSLRIKGDHNDEASATGKLEG